jgi:hypothetical protein
MSIDWPHMIISVLLIFATVLLVQRAPVYKQGSRGKRAVIVGVAVGLVMLVFNLIWPCGEGTGITVEPRGGREDTIAPQSEPAGAEVPGQGN